MNPTPYKKARLRKDGKLDRRAGYEPTPLELELAKTLKPRAWARIGSRDERTGDKSACTSSVTYARRALDFMRKRGVEI